MTAHGRVVAMLIIIAGALAACDRSPRPGATSAPTAEPSFTVELKPLTPLLPNRPTHVAVDPLGNIFWVQETERSDDTLFVIGEGDVPRATQLTAATISAQLGNTSGRGHIHGLAAGPGGEIYFYYFGLAARQPMAAFGRYLPKSATIQLLADTNAIATATDMGRSLPLARGSLIADRHIIWLWLRHSDAWSLFRIDTRKLPSSGSSPLTRAFTSVKLDERPIDLTRDEYDLAPAGDENLFLLDPLEGRVLKITPEGVATVVRSLVGLPSIISTPTVDREGKLLLFAAAPGANVPVIQPAKIEDTNAPKPPDVTFPAMLVFGAGDHITAIGRDDIIAYPGFPVFGMRLRQLIPHPGEEGWVSYDSGSGELLQLKIKEKIW